MKTIFKIIIILLIIFIALSAYYFFTQKKSKNDLTDPLWCSQDEDCTYYNVINCTNAKPINKDYKSKVLQLIEPKDQLCGEIKTACKNSQCIIVK